MPEMICQDKQELWYHEPEEVRPAKKNSNFHLQTLVTHGPGDRHEDDEHVQLRGEEHLALHHADEAGLQADHVERVQVSNRESVMTSIAANSVTLRVREISLTVRSLRVVSLFKGAVGSAGVWSQSFGSQRKV